MTTHRAATIHTVYAALAELPVLMTTSQVADLLQVSRRKVEVMSADGTLAKVKVGRTVRFYRDDVAGLIERSYQPPS